MRYVHDVPADDDTAIEATRGHVVAQLSAVAAADDDPDTNAAAVRVWTERHPEDDRMLRIVGELDAEPDAPYPRPGYDALAGVDPDLYAAEVAAAVRDLEALGG